MAEETVVTGIGGTARQLAEEFAQLAAKLNEHTEIDDVLGGLAAAAVRLVPHAEHAATSRREGAGFVTVGATSDVPLQVDRIQYELGHGPCVDAILDHNMFNAADLLTDPRWPEFGRRAAETTGIRSMLSFRLFFEDPSAADLLAGLNLYTAAPNAFGEDDETVMLLIATSGALAVTAAQQRQLAAGLTTALQSNRDIGAAIGVLMTRLQITRQQAFDLMRIASQRSNRKLREIAREVLETSTLDIPEPPSRTGTRGGRR